MGASHITYAEYLEARRVVNTFLAQAAEPRTYTCAACGVQFEAQRRARTCSPACRDKARKPRSRRKPTRSAAL